MTRKPQPITLARIAADIIHGAEAEPVPVLRLDPDPVRALEVAGRIAAAAISGDPAHLEAGEPMTTPGGVISRETAEQLGRRISDAWGMIKAHDSTGAVDIQENAEGLWYAVWRDHAGVVIAESTPVTTAEQAGKLVAWMRENAAAAREEVIEGKFAEAQVLAASAPTLSFTEFQENILRKAADFIGIPFEDLTKVWVSGPPGGSIDPDAASEREAGDERA